MIMNFGAVMRTRTGGDEGGQIFNTTPVVSNKPRPPIYAPKPRPIITSISSAKPSSGSSAAKPQAPIVSVAKPPVLSNRPIARPPIIRAMPTSARPRTTSKTTQVVTQATQQVGRTIYGLSLNTPTTASSTPIVAGSTTSSQPTMNVPTQFLPPGYVAPPSSTTQQPVSSTDPRTDVEVMATDYSSNWFAPAAITATPDTEETVTVPTTMSVKPMTVNSQNQLTVAKSKTPYWIALGIGAAVLAAVFKKRLFK